VSTLPSAPFTAALSKLGAALNSQKREPGGRKGRAYRGITIVHRTVFAALTPRRFILFGSVALAGLVATPGARAFEYQEGDYQINLDTTLSSGVSLRTSPVDQAFVGIDNGGTFGVANYDNGDLNFKPGNVVEAQQRITTELQVKRDDYGIFVRATGFYDPVYDSDIDSRPFPLDRAAVRDIGADLRLLDAYVFFSPSFFGHPVDFRIGNQALNWGESTFIGFGINTITPLDTTQLHTPGAELRTAFLPVPAVDAKTEIIPDLTIEGFWQPYWTRTRLDPVGSFFNTSDGLFDGGTYSNLFSLYPDSIRSGQLVNLLPQANPFGGVLIRSDDQHPTGVGEYGFALRKNVPALGDAEFGLYFESYDSRVPFASFRTGNSNIGGLPGPLSVLPNVNLFSLLALPPQFATKTYVDTASFYADYPKDIHLLGFSWNFSAPFGVAIQGEISHRFDQPIQLSASDLALAVNAPAICKLAQSPLFAGAVGPACAEAREDQVIQTTGGVAGFDSNIQGWVRKPVTQIQSTATKLFNSIPSLDINSIALIGEMGFDYVSDFGNRGLYDEAYTTDANSAFVEAATVDTKPYPGTNYSVGHLATKGLATAFSGGGTAEMIVDMPNVMPYGIGMKPTISVTYDFVGTSPVGVNQFLENTAAASVGVTFTYLQAWSLGMQYTNHFPVFAGGKYYGLIDRDFVSATLSYEF
jgi:hypothetical protein